MIYHSFSVPLRHLDDILKVCKIIYKTVIDLNSSVESWSGIGWVNQLKGSKSSRSSSHRLNGGLKVGLIEAHRLLQAAIDRLLMPVYKRITVSYSTYHPCWQCWDMRIELFYVICWWLPAKKMFIVLRMHKLYCWKSTLSLACLWLKMCWIWSIDFLITLSLLNNQATANALVITIQLAGQGLWRQTVKTLQQFIHNTQGWMDVWMDDLVFWSSWGLLYMAILVCLTRVTG